MKSLSYSKNKNYLIYVFVFDELNKHVHVLFIFLGMIEKNGGGQGIPSRIEEYKIIKQIPGILVFLE